MAVLRNAPRAALKVERQLLTEYLTGVSQVPQQALQAQDLVTDRISVGHGGVKLMDLHSDRYPTPDSWAPRSASISWRKRAFSSASPFSARSTFRLKSACFSNEANR